MNFIFLESTVLEQLDDRATQSPEDMLAFLEAKLESGEFTIEEATQYLQDQTQPSTVKVTK